MQTMCDGCKKKVKQVGRLSNIKYKGISQKLCKKCKDKLKQRFR